jgi:adenosylcobalamin-dependent ribonucleoside-triphosphate reductase
MNLIGVAVVAGNVRRTAEIVFGDSKSNEYLKLKDYHWDSVTAEYVGSSKHRADYGWTSNNSIFANLGMDYSRVAEQTAHNGEPGYAWLENIRGYSRMNNGPDNKDHRAAGANPCSEQSLESYELCCLVETFPDNHENLEDYLRTLKFAYLYAKTVTLGKTHWPETNRVMLRNRRIGCSMSGIAQFLQKKGLHTLKNWCEKGYQEIQNWDELYSEWLAIPRSIKTTSVKPSGTVSLLAGATPGIHFPQSRFYIRRLRLSANSTLIKPLEKAGYFIEKALKEDNTMIVEIPIDVGEGVRTLKEVSMWEQLSLAAFMQHYWADNQVSATITFDPVKEGPQISAALNYFQYQLKGVSFLPNAEEGSYAQMPYEEIDEKMYREKAKGLKRIKFENIKGEEAEIDKFCNNDVCEIPA